MRRNLTVIVIQLIFHLLGTGNANYLIILIIIIIIVNLLPKAAMYSLVAMVEFVKLF